MTGAADTDARARALQDIVVLAREHQLTVSEITAALSPETNADLSAGARSSSYTVTPSPRTNTNYGRT
jgi:hypothetical protein